VTRCIAGETIIVPVSGRISDLESIFTLNETGSVIWDLVDGELSVGRIAEALHGEFDASREDLERDVSEFLTSLESEGLIQPARSEVNSS